MRIRAAMMIERAREDFKQGKIDAQTMVDTVIAAGRIGSERARLIRQASKILGHKPT
ncbi:MAG: hypothetical protein AB1492_01440 [Bacillota bacterium]